MKISLNEIKKYVDIKISTDELVKLIGSRLVEVEGTEDLSPKYKNIYIVKVVDCKDIEGTHLHLCQIDAGKEDLVQVVCGAPNVHKGMLAAWIAPGAIVPATYGGENFEIGVRKLRGYESNGMLAAADELALGTDHEGIIEIDPKLAKPGELFADVFELNDVILDIENKSLTHRPDTFGLIGFAREVAGILGQPFKEPDFLKVHGKVNFTLQKDAPIQIEIKDDKLCPRYSCAILDFTNLPKATKYFTKTNVFLAKADMRSIDPIVDLTNILMLETGQPLHAFDYDKFVAVGKSKTPKIIVRLAKEGEKLTLLDGKEIVCTKYDILITSNNIPVALAGAMGGANTTIDASTKKIILESATFSLYNLRKTQMAHGIFSEAITRFTKGQPAGLTMPVLSEFVRRLNVEPIAIADEYPHPAKPSVVKITTKEINGLLGSNYDTKTIEKTLKNVSFNVKAGFEITAPYWRTDIHIKEDIIEEVGRLLGYDNIALDFPLRPFIGAEPDPLFSLKTKIRNLMSDKIGANEVLTYSFISKDLLTKVNQKVEDSYEIVNSISPELQCFRQTIAPSLIDKIRENLKAGYGDFTLYEINQVSSKKDGLNEEKVPVTKTHLAFVTLGDYYAAKAISEKLFAGLKYEVSLAKFDNDYPYLESAHAAQIRLGKTILGSFGEVRQTVLSKFKLQAPVTIFEINLDTLLNAKTIDYANANLSRFPYVERDLTFKLPNNNSYAELEQAVRKALNDADLVFELAPVSIYQASKTDSTRNISFHTKFASREKTLDSKAISAIIEKVIKNTKSLGAEVV